MMHRHQWEIHTLTHNPGAGVSEVRGIAPERLERLVYGFTNIVQKCSKCSLTKVETHAGRVDL